MKLSQAAYDRAQWFIRIFIPAFITLYIGVDQFVNLPKETEVAGIAGLLAVFLGGLLAKSSADFKKNNEPHAGFIQQTGVDPDTGNPDMALTFTKLPQELLGKKTITLNVDTPATVMPPVHVTEHVHPEDTPPPAQS